MRPKRDFGGYVEFSVHDENTAVFCADGEQLAVWAVPEGCNSVTHETTRLGGERACSLEVPGLYRPVGLPDHERLARRMHRNRGNITLRRIDILPCQPAVSYTPYESTRRGGSGQQSAVAAEGKQRDCVCTLARKWSKRRFISFGGRPRKRANLTKRRRVQ